MIITAKDINSYYILLCNLSGFLFLCTGINLSVNSTLYEFI